MSSRKSPAFPPALDPRFRTPAKQGIVARLPLKPPAEGQTPRPRVALGTDVPRDFGASAPAARPPALPASWAVPTPPAPAAAQPPATRRRRSGHWWSLVPAALLGFGVAFVAVFAFRYAAGLGPSMPDADDALLDDALLAEAPGPSAPDRLSAMPSAAVVVDSIDNGSRPDVAPTDGATAEPVAEAGDSESEAVEAVRLAAPVEDAAADDDSGAAAERGHAGDDDETAAERGHAGDDDETAAEAVEAPAVLELDDADEDDASTDRSSDTAGERPARERDRSTRERRTRRERTAPSRRSDDADQRSDDDDEIVEIDGVDDRAASDEGATAYLTIDATPYATVFVDGKRIGDTPLVRVAIPSGRRRVRAVTADGTSKTFSIEVGAGDTVRRRMTFD